MKTAIYKLAGDVPERYKGLEIPIPEAENDEELLEQAVDVDARRKATQASYDIARQRVAKTVANRLRPDIDQAEGEATIIRETQEYVYGQKTDRAAANAETRQMAEQARKIAEAKASDPELAAKLAALGVTL